MNNEPSDKNVFDENDDFVDREKDLHILVCGTFSSGKTSFIQTISEYFASKTMTGIPVSTVLTTDPKMFEGLKNIKLRLFFGRMKIDEEMALYFHEPPQNRRFVYTLDLLESRNLLGAIILVDSIFPESFPETRRTIETFRTYNPIPFVVAANKQNLPNALPPEYVHERLFLDDDTAVLPCNSQDKASVQSVILALLEKVLQSIEEYEMSESTPAQVVEALWAAFDRFEFTAAAPLLHDEFVCEFPQSGEVMRGRDNFIAMNQHYPGQWRCSIQQLVAEGDKVVTETRVSDGDQVFTALSFFTFKDGQIVHLREYWPDPMPAQEWRAQWVEKQDA